MNEKYGRSPAVAALMPELKIGQVWASDGDSVKIVAVGPEYIGVEPTKAGVRFQRHAPGELLAIGWFRCHYSLVHPGHVLWVNVYRADNGNIHGYVETGTRGALGWCASNLAGARIACLKIEFEEGEGLDDGLTNRS